MAAEPNRLSIQEYLRLERQAETKNEYMDGEMIAMTGASRRHNLIVANLLRDLGNQLKHRACELFPSDLRARIPSANVYTYPDMSAVCGEPHFEDDEAEVVKLAGRHAPLDVVEEFGVDAARDAALGPSA